MNGALASGDRLSDGEIEDKADSQFHSYKMRKIDETISKLYSIERYAIKIRYKERVKDTDGNPLDYNHEYANRLFTLGNTSGTYQSHLRIAQNRFSDLFF